MTTPSTSASTGRALRWDAVRDVRRQLHTLARQADSALWAVPSHDDAVARGACATLAAAIADALPELTAAVDDLRLMAEGVQ